MIRKKTQTFNSGTASFRRLENKAGPGEKPKPAPVVYLLLRYHRRTVGMSRYWTALQAGTKVSEVIRCPYNPDVGEKDQVTLNGQDSEIFEIKQIQYPEDAVPPVMDLTLERVEYRGGKAKPD